MIWAPSVSAVLSLPSAPSVPPLPLLPPIVAVVDGGVCGSRPSAAADESCGVCE